MDASHNASGEEPRSARSRGFDEAAATARQTVEQAAQTAAKVGAQAAQVAAQVGAQVGARFEQTVNDPQLLGRIPGRSVSIVGLGLMALAILLSLLPWFYGIGLGWSLVMLLGGALTAFLELRSGGVALPQVKLPPALLNPLIPPVFAALVAVQAFTDGQELVVDGRLAGLAVAALALAIRAPFIVVLVLAGAAGALVQALTG